MYWYPIEQTPNSPEMEEKYRRMIDQFHELGGDLIIFNPLTGYRQPGIDEKSCWELAPPGTGARRILDYADKQGIHYGFYMGVAGPRNADQGNACGLPFVPEHKDWKKVDPLGGMSGENCLACDEFAQWWYAVQRNTIAKYKLGLWSWDPGPGHGCFCYSDQHGHVPGKGAYKGWRNATALMGRLKHEFPDLQLMAFYGRKEYGLWGLKHFDEHEAYWEQTAQYDATLYPDLHDDRVNADGARFQSWWNENFRFLPTSMNHALAFRVGENSFPSQLPKVWDHLGWRYSFMSGLATSGSVTACILPEDLENVPGMRDFYRHWLDWARRNSEYIKYNVSFGAQVRIGGVDGHARIKGDHGFIFLCNPAPRPARINLTLDERVGLDAKGRFTLKELYPTEDRLIADVDSGRGIFHAGDGLTVEVPAHEVLLLELERFSDQQLPLVFGISGKHHHVDARITVMGARGQPGEEMPVTIATRQGQSIESLRINDQIVPITRRASEARAVVRFAGDELPRLLDDWRTEKGARFAFPFHPAAEIVTLRSAFYASPAIQTILAAAAPRNLAEIAPLVDRWRTDHQLPQSFVWARPDRLWLVLPFADSGRVRSVELRVNGAGVPVTGFSVAGARIAWYADLTDAVKWNADNELTLRLQGVQANQFLGPYLDYPPASPTRKLDTPEKLSRGRVVYDRTIDEETPGRVVAIGGTAPRIHSAKMDPPFVGSGRPITFIATVDLPPERLRGVYLSAGWVGSDVPLRYDPRTKSWRFECPSPRRYPILDGDRAVIWAIGKDGAVSQSQTIPVKWILGGFDSNAVVRSLECNWPNQRDDALKAIESLGDARLALPLARAAEKTSDPKNRASMSHVLGGLLRRSNPKTADDCLAAAKIAMTLTTDPAEKKLLRDAIAAIPGPAARDYLSSLQGNPTSPPGAESKVKDR
jgi:hypothetical protein